MRRREFITLLGGAAAWPVYTENVIRIDLMKESLNVGHDGRAGLLLSDVAGVAVQVEEPT